MAKIQNISEIHPTLGFTEFDIIEKYRKSFHESELGRLHSAFPFERMAKTMGFSEQRLGRRNIFSPSAKIAQDYQKRLSIIRKVLVQEKDLFEGRKVSDRIVSIDRHYVRPIVRGKEIKSVEFGAKVNKKMAYEDDRP